MSTYIDKQGVLAELATVDVGFKRDGTVAVTQNPVLFNPATARRSSNPYQEGKIYLGYDHFALADTSNPNVAVNRLQFTPNTEEFLRIPNSAINSLRPLVRLYEIIAHPELSGRYLVPIPLPTVAFGAGVAEGDKPANVNNYKPYGSTKAAPADHGLLDVSLDFKATNPAEINNNIECKIRFFFSSVQGLNQRMAVDVSSDTMIPHPNSADPLFDPAYWNFMRLVTRGQNFTNKLKMVIGYDPLSPIKTMPHATFGRSEDREQYKKLFNFFQNHMQVLELSLREHTIDVNENGSVMLNIVYHAGVTGELMDTKKSDIFGFFYHNTEKRAGSNKTRLEEYQAALRDVKKQKQTNKKDAGNPSPPSTNTSDDGPDYTREWLRPRKYSKVLERGQKGTQDDIGKWLQRSGTDLEKRERFLTRIINQIIYSQQQALGGIFWDFLIKQKKIRKVMVPLAYFERKSNNGSGKSARTDEEKCLDLLAQVPFVQLQQTNSDGGSVTQADYRRTQNSFVGPLEDLRTLGGRYLDPNSKLDPDNSLYEPTEWNSDDNTPVATKMNESIESEYLKRMFKITAQILRNGSKNLDDLNKNQTDAQDKFLDDQDPDDLLQDIISNFPGTEVAVKRAYEAALRGGQGATDNKKLVQIEYVFLGDILDGILGAHQLGQLALYDLGGPKAQPGFVIDTSKSIVLNNIDMTGAGRCSDVSKPTAYFSRQSGGQYGFSRNKEAFKNANDATMIKNAKTRSIADLPISLETLSNWWISNVVDPFRSEWALGDFLGSVVTQLIPAGLGLSSGRSSKLNQQTAQRPQISVLEVDFGSYEAKKAGFIRNLVEHKDTILDETNSQNNIISDDDLAALSLAKPPSRYNAYRATPAGAFEKDMISDKSATLLFLDVAPVRRTDLSADRVKDHKVGVWHFYLARDAGPIMAYSFSRNEIAYLSEANVFRDGSGGIAEDASSGIAYNVNLKMLGHKLFNPGTTFYLDLIGLGFGSTRNESSPARQLNIGGYYTVKSVKSNLGIDGYYTDIEGVWQPTVIPEEE